MVRWVTGAAGPGAITAGGRVIWVANVADETLTRIDAETRRVIGIVPLPGSPDGLALAFDAVWVVHGRLGELSSVDPAFPRDVQTFAIGSRASRFARGAVAPGLGSLWAAFGDASLARVDPQLAARVELGVRGRGARRRSWSRAVSVWVANFAGSNVQRFNPLTFDQGPVERLAVGEGPSGPRRGCGIGLGRLRRRRPGRPDLLDGNVQLVAVDDPRRGLTGRHRVRRGRRLGREWRRRNGIAHRPGDEQGHGRDPGRRGPVGHRRIAGGEVWVTVQAP